MTGNGIIAGARVLVAEDEALVAMDLEATLTELGCVVLGPVATVAEATALLARERPDAALLDLGLLDGFAAPVAEALGRTGVPFALVTSYPDGGPLDHPALRGAARLRKPYDVPDLRRIVAGLVGERAEEIPPGDPRERIVPLIPYLRAVARDFTRDPGAADGLVRDALVRALAEWDDLARGGDLRSRLLGILRDCAAGSMEPGGA